MAEGGTESLPSSEDKENNVENVPIEMGPSERELNRLEKAQTTALFNENATRNMERRLEYLIKESQLYDHFITNSKRREGRGSQKNKKFVKGKEGKAHKAGENSQAKDVFKFYSTPDFIQNGVMRDYQIEGLNWMISLYENGISGILADEMGLGKTLQTISFLGYLKHTKELSSKLKYLVVVPKSTMQNWLNEFKRWCPTIKVLALQGEKYARKRLIKTVLKRKQWDVLLTSYQMVFIEFNALLKTKYHTIILDEGHSIKNEQSLTARQIRKVKTNHKMILTGTPIHNKVHEFWALMNFLMPDIFNSGEDFDRWFEDMEVLNNAELTDRLKAIIKPFLLRRIKSDVEKQLLPKQELKVYVGMTDMQEEWYRKVLLKDVELINEQGYKYKMKIDCLIMHLRKVTNHPYLFEGAEEGPPFIEGDHVIENSAKMVVLDKLLSKFKAEGSRVLIFSQMTRMLDIIEDYCQYRKYSYSRLDGSLLGDDRTKQIDDFSKSGSDKFIFLLSTRAGGLGINLASADIVILYDSDWNPQMDLQAMDRAHRIGQTKQVKVFRLIVEKSVDERIVECAEMKFALDQKLIKGNHGARSNMLKRIVTMDMEQHIQGKAVKLVDEDLDTLLTRCQERQKKEDAEKADVMVLKHKYESLYKFDGEDYKEKQEQMRQKVQNQTEDIPRWTRRARAAGPASGPSLDDQPFYLQKYYAFWFFSKPLFAFIQKEKLFYMKIKGIQGRNANERTAIESAKCLTHTERLEYEKLLRSSFKDWTVTHFEKFIKASAKFGRNEIDKIRDYMRVQVLNNQLEDYAKVFWERYKEIPNYQKYIKIVEDGEARLNGTQPIKRTVEISSDDDDVVLVSPPPAKIQRTDAIETIDLT
ncbi:chromatin-remodeling complex ATPase chain Iswi-like [Phlebotomus papatasi]|uniref:chromatin-remodeling complex ATPase chain Iswi-like n=1 Tax=Phlebotomus papatasi TaxID=29031 RepID=UPI0024846EC6|nr:chromatin-remodeling complex ATPase chain Iswi-like [Phlebotomus papatasi]